MAATADDPQPGEDEASSEVAARVEADPGDAYAGPTHESDEPVANPEAGDRAAGPDASDHGVRDALAGRSLWRNLISLAILLALAAGLFLAVPGLRGVARQVSHMNVGWLLAGVVLEILSCAGFILAFLQVFERAPVRLGARVALSELAFNSAVSLGGVGSVAVGAWLLVERGADATRVAERSAVLFLLTTAVNVITLVLAGLLLWVGILPGNQNPWLSLVPAIVGIVGFAAVLALPRVMERVADHRAPGKMRTLLVEAAVSIRLTEQVLFRWDWRIIGAIAYLWCDIAVLVVCFAAAGPVPPVVIVVLAYQIGYLSNLIPVPGGIGVLDGSLVGLFALYGGTSATLATAATVVYHAISLWVPAVWGTISFVILRHTRDRPIRLRPPRQERRRSRRGGRNASDDG